MTDFTNDYLTGIKRLIHGEQHGRAFSESFNSRYPASGENLGGLSFAQPAAFYGQTNMQNADANNLWRTFNMPQGLRLAFNIPSYYSYNGNPETNGTRRYLLNQTTGEIEPYEIKVALPTRYEEFRVLAGVSAAEIAGEPGKVIPQTTIYEYIDAEECGFPNYAINDADVKSTGYTGIGGYILPNNYVEGDIATDEKYDYGAGSSEIHYFKRIINMQYPELSVNFGWGYGRDEYVNAEYLQRTGKIKTSDGYTDLYAALLITSTDETISYGGAGTEYEAVFEQKYVESAALRISYKESDITLPLGEYHLTSGASSLEFGTSIYPLSLNIFDAETEGIGGSPTVTFCYQEWTNAPENDAVVYAVTCYPFETYYIYRKANGGESNGRRYIEFEENGESRKYYIGDDSELVLTEEGSKNDNA